MRVKDWNEAKKNEVQTMKCDETTIVEVDPVRVEMEGSVINH